MAQALMVAGTVVSAVGTIVGAEAQANAYTAGAKAENELAEYQAKQMTKQAGRERATAQRGAIEERRKANLARSRATAVAAASGGGVQGTDVENILSNLDAEGKYNALSVLYEGEQRAQGLEEQAYATKYGAAVNSNISKYQARTAKRMSYVSAAGDLMQGSSTFYDKFWPSDSPSTASTGSVSQGRSGTKFGKYSSQVAYG